MSLLLLLQSRMLLIGVRYTPTRSKCQDGRSTTTSFAILGLLAVQPWATYDLAKLMRRSLHFFWPRAESNLYAEPKRLVDTPASPRPARSGTATGRRTVYSITDRGRDGAAGVARDTTSPGAGRVGGPPAAALRKLRLQGRPAQRRSSRSKTTRRGRSTTTPGSRPSTHAERDSSPIGST